MTSLLNPCSFLLTVLAFFTAVARAQTPLGDLAKPPADAQYLIISSTGGKHGDSWIWQTPDGTRMARAFRTNALLNLHEIHLITCCRGAPAPVF